MEENVCPFESAWSNWFNKPPKLLIVVPLLAKLYLFLFYLLSDKISSSSFVVFDLFLFRSFFESLLLLRERLESSVWRLCDDEWRFLRRLWRSEPRWLRLLWPWRYGTIAGLKWKQRIKLQSWYEYQTCFIQTVNTCSIVELLYKLFHSVIDQIISR